MSTEPIVPSTSSEADSDDGVAPNTDYSRWMTNMAGIEELGLHHLAIPGAHNSGVDMAGTWGIEELLAACQNNSFHHQLKAGARYLDLRLEDKSYWKLSGTHYTQRTLVESLEFTHGNDAYWYQNVSAGRKLQDLIYIARLFSTENPGEIIILDIRKFKKKSDDSLKLAYPHLTPIKHLLIPNSAYGLSIGEIRRKHPDRNIILSFDHGTPEHLKPEWVQAADLWPTIKHIWSPADDEENIENLVAETMHSPPTEKYWALSAACRNANGPMHLKANHPIRTKPFNVGQQNINILMVDFIERPDTITSVTEACIALNTRRVNLPPPSPPKNLTAIQLHEQDKQNTVEFNWERGQGDIEVRKYEIYEGDNLLITTSEVPHREHNFPRKNWTFRVRAFNAVDKPSAFSAPFVLTQDTIPPTTPENIRIYFLGITSIDLTWDPSYDEAGIEIYEVNVDNQAPLFVSGTRAIFRNLLATQTYTFRVRAKDINGFYSEYAEFELGPRSVKLTNPILNIVSIATNDTEYTGFVSWDPPASPVKRIFCKFTINGSPMRGMYLNGDRPNIEIKGRTGTPTTITAQQEYSMGEVGEVSTFSFTVDATPLPPITNLQLISRTIDASSISWTSPDSSKVTSHAISVNRACPILVPKAVTNYVFENYQLPKRSLSRCGQLDNSPLHPSSNLSSLRASMVHREFHAIFAIDTHPYDISSNGSRRLMQ